MVNLGLAVGANHLNNNGPDRVARTDQFGFAYGITDRLELNQLSLRYALFDDAPPPALDAPPRPRDRLTLVLQAGFFGFGFSSTDGLLLLPVVSGLAGKHLGQRAYVWTQLGWTAFWTSDGPNASSYSAYLYPRQGDGSSVYISSGLDLQVVNRLVWSVSAGASQLRACAFPVCDWAARGGSASTGPTFRPWHWLTLRLGVHAGVRARSNALIAASPDAPLPPPADVTWYGGTVAVSFFW